jgi:hypothetical protein
MFDAKHWRVRAEEARVHAGEMQGEDARQAMLAIAEAYEKLAERAETTKRDRAN